MPPDVAPIPHRFRTTFAPAEQKKQWRLPTWFAGTVKICGCHWGRRRQHRAWVGHGRADEEMSDGALIQKGQPCEWAGRTPTGRDRGRMRCNWGMYITYYSLPHGTIIMQRQRQRQTQPRNGVQRGNYHPQRCTSAKPRLTGGRAAIGTHAQRTTANNLPTIRSLAHCGRTRPSRMASYPRGHAEGRYSPAGGDLAVLLVRGVVREVLENRSASLLCATRIVVVAGRHPGACDM